MAEKIETILDQIKGLTLLEANELVTKLEEVFNIDVRSVGAVAVAAPAAGGADAGGAGAEEKTEFDLVLEAVAATSKIAVLKVVRNITGLGLKEAKELIEDRSSSADLRIIQGVEQFIENKIEVNAYG